MSSFSLIHCENKPRVFNRIVEKYSLVDTYKKTGDSEEDFIVIKKPKLIDRYDSVERVRAECKNNNLAALYNLYTNTGDTSVFNQRKNAVYGDVTQINMNLGVKLDKKVETEKVLNKASISDVEEALKIQKMSKKEFTEYIEALVNKKLNVSKEDTPVPPKASVDVPKEAK